MRKRYARSIFTPFTRQLRLISDFFSILDVGKPPPICILKYPPPSYPPPFPSRVIHKFLSGDRTGNLVEYDEGSCSQFDLLFIQNPFLLDQASKYNGAHLLYISRRLPISWILYIQREHFNSKTSKRPTSPAASSSYNFPETGVLNSI